MPPCCIASATATTRLLKWGGRGAFLGLQAVEDHHGWQLGRIENPAGHECEIGRPLGAWSPELHHKDDLTARLGERLTYANVTATLALFAALGGGSFAVAALSGSEKKVVKRIATKQA
jgi:hypothetical protein